MLISLEANLIACLSIAYPEELPYPDLPLTGEDGQSPHSQAFSPSIRGL